MVRARVLLGIALFFIFVPDLAQGEKRRGIVDLTNFALSPEYSQWLVGPIARIAKPSEVDAFLAMVDDEVAAEFVEAFWAKRVDPSNPWPDQQPRAIFEARAEEADRRFTEGVNLGRRTDRGEIFIVFGEPPETDYEDDQDSRYGPIEVWRYGKKAPKGLGGEKPKKLYRFLKKGEVTEFYSPSPSLRRRPSRGVIN